MPKNQNRLLLALGPLLGVSWALLALLDPDEGSSQMEHVGIGLLLGIMFGETTAAAAWTALGPFPQTWRLPLSLVWLMILALAFTVNMTLHGGGGDDIAWILAGCLFGQWLLVQLPLWTLALFYGLRLRHRDEAFASDLRHRQFGIRQLMILTLIVAVVLGLGRVLVAEAAKHLGARELQDALIFVCLAVAGMVMTLPLLLAGLLSRFALIAVPAVLALIALATWYELPLLTQIAGGAPGPNQWHLIFINAFQAAWVLAILAVVRWCGYGFWPPASSWDMAAAVDSRPTGVI